MIIILIFIGVLISTFDLKAQEWFPLGASWYYNQVVLLEGETYSYFEVTGETIIQGKTCRVISGSCNCTAPGAGGYFYQEGDKIFAFDAEADSFRIFYDFSLEAGDTIIFKGDPLAGGDGSFLIDSITIMQVGAQNLRVQHITTLNFDIVWGDKIIERIGSNGCFYPQVAFCDPLTGGLRCYEDEEIGLINFQMPPRSCYYNSVGINEASSVPVIKIYPNPASNIVHIQSENPIERITLFNNLAIPVYQHSSILNTEYEVLVRSLPAGLYYMEILLSDHQVMQKALVIQK